MRVGHVGHPVTHRLVDGVLERAAPTVHGLDLGAEQLHAEHVEFLAFDVDGAHVHLALQAHERRCGGAGDPVLAGAGVGDDALLAHPLGEQRLADDVVDLVRAGVVEVLALEDQADAESGAEVVALGQDRRAARVLRVHPRQLGAELGVDPRLVEGRLEFLARRHQRLGHETSAELTESAGRVGRSGQGDRGVSSSAVIRSPSRRACCRRRGTASTRAARAFSMKRFTAIASLLPGERSTPLETSTPHGCTSSTRRPRCRG